ncbi:MAG TPA: hypothetical protein PKD76_11065 [Solirubrobacterales bacterium]|nr:hypothetical protein [Solirubrobacterales bacterium]
MSTAVFSRIRLDLVLALLLGLAIAAVLPATSKAGNEIADIAKVGKDRKGPMDVLLAMGENPITHEAFETYTPPPRYIKNTERTAQFNYQETLSSPGEKEPDVTTVVTPEGYTWIIVAQIKSAMWPYDAAQYPEMDPPPTSAWDAAFQTPTPPNGVVRYSANQKNQDMYFWARNDNGEGERILRYFITDNWGNTYMMMASNMRTPEETTQAFRNAALPAGWKKSTRYLRKTRVVSPAYDLGSSANFNIFRDSADNSWVQVGWGKDGRSIAQQIGDGMPIWGGKTSDRILGTKGDDTINGAEGNDLIKPFTGNDKVYGDKGRNTVVLPGKAKHYRVVSQNRSTVKLAGNGGQRTLKNIQRVRFSDRSCSMVKLRADARRGNTLCKVRTSAG